MPIRALLFDLDDTLLLDEEITREAFAAAGAAASSLKGIDAGTFVRFAAEEAERVWEASAFHDYCRGIGIAASECLWASFSSAGPTGFPEWVLGFGQQVFATALLAEGIDDPALASELAAVFASTRRKGQRLMPGAVQTILALGSQYRLGLLTNGDPSVQRGKIVDSGLVSHFAATVISGEHGIGKPDPRIFHVATAMLGVPATETAMVGNSLQRDIAGARGAGFAASIWLRVPGAEEPADVCPDREIASLEELPDALKSLSRTDGQ